jgi:hypothetical protein
MGCCENTESLELLEILTDLNIRDPRLQDAIEIIKSKQMKDGWWKLEDSNNGKMLIILSHDGLNRLIPKSN